MNAKNGLLVACALACAAALAQTPADDSTASADSAAVQLSPKTENGITYLCGGIGVIEAAQMKREAADYNLMLTFAENTGAYLANVSVDIADARGTPLLQTTCDAPILLVNFPRAGRYRITAEAEGNPVTRVLRIRPGSKHNAVALLWPRRLIENAQGTQTR